MKLKEKIMTKLNDEMNNSIDINGWNILDCDVYFSVYNPKKATQFDVDYTVGKYDPHSMPAICEEIDRRIYLLFHNDAEIIYCDVELFHSISGQKSNFRIFDYVKTEEFYDVA